MEDLNFRKGDAKTDVFGSDRMLQPSPVEKIPEGPTTPEIAYQMVKDETFAQTQPRLNLATFVTTYMDDYATKLMNEAININYIDETEYPRIAVMNGKCINIVANLWNSPEKDTWKTGALAIGSSEACMLGGVAAWLRWRKKRQAQGKPFDKPNFVISTGFQVVWEKFAQLWQIEMREVPLTLDKTTLDPEEALKMCDENTICVVPIQGVTWTGLNDDVEALDKALDAYNAKTGYDIPIHVDAASGGFILPFLYPDTKWDFRLKWVLSISVSGHKFGLVYPGLGWVCWKGKEYLPEEMAFSVNYLGANITQVGLNFSRPAAQILGQYYQFIRLGFQGYKEVQYNSLMIAKYIHDEIAKMAVFFLADRCFQRYRFLCNLLYFSYLVYGQSHFLGDFFRGRLTPVSLKELSGYTDEFVDGLNHVNRDTNGSCLVCNRTRDCLADPPCRIGGELVSLGVVKLVYRLDKA